MRRAAPLLLLAAAALAACAPRAAVVVSKDYDPAKIKRVAMAAIDDFPGAAGSGDIAAGTFEKYLLLSGYSLVERRQAAQILKEHDFNLSGEVSPDQLRQAGRLLGVDAIVIGGVTDYTNARDQTVMVDMPQEQTDPIYGQVVTTQRTDQGRVRTVQNVVTGYATTFSSQLVPETTTVPAHAALSLRLVDVETGEVLWSAGAGSDGGDLASALEAASAAAAKAIAKKLPKSKG